jgi:hypothetical protein
LLWNERQRRHRIKSLSDAPRQKFAVPGGVYTVVR